MALDATIGSADANSYVTVEEASAFLANRLNASVWTEAGEESPPRQEAALVTATRRLDQERWRWSKASDDQALEFPRTGQADKNGTAIDEDTLPKWLKHATIELALAMLTEDLLEGTGLEGMRRVKIDVLEFEPVVGASTSGLPANVRRYFPEAALDGSGITFPIVRG